MKITIQAEKSESLKKILKLKTKIKKTLKKTKQKKLKILK